MYVYIYIYIYVCIYIYICITITNYYQHVLTIIPYDSRITLSLLDHFGHGIIPPNPERHVRRVRLPGSQTHLKAAPIEAIPWNGVEHGDG